jgi:Na+-translocating ferredoxin:NAD+ oxidoreductase RnfG subunit
MSNNNVSNIILDAIEAIVDPQLTEIRGSIPKVERMTITAVLKDGYKVDGLEDRVVTSETKKLYNIGDEVTVYYDNSAAIILTSVTTANDAFG